MANLEENMQSQINHLSGEVTRLGQEVGASVATQILNHAENQEKIRNLNDGQRQFVIAMTEGFAKIALSLEEALKPIKTDIFNLQMWRSKTTGYVLGVAGLAALVFKLIETILTRFGAH